MMKYVSFVCLTRTIDVNTTENVNHVILVNTKGQGYTRTGVYSYSPLEKKHEKCRT